MDRLVDCHSCTICQSHGLVTRRPTMYATEMLMFTATTPTVTSHPATFPYVMVHIPTMSEMKNDPTPTARK